MTAKTTPPTYTNRHNEVFTVGDAVRIDGASWGDSWSAIIQAIDGSRVYVAFVRDNKSTTFGQSFVRGKDVMKHENATAGKKRVVDAFRAMSVPLNK